MKKKIKGYKILIHTFTKRTDEKTKQIIIIMITKNNNNKMKIILTIIIK